MSATGTKRTLRLALGMSAFGGNADIILGKADADIGWTYCPSVQSPKD